MSYLTSPERTLPQQTFTIVDAASNSGVSFDLILVGLFGSNTARLEVGGVGYLQALNSLHSTQVRITAIDDDVITVDSIPSTEEAFQSDANVVIDLSLYEGGTAYFVRGSVSTVTSGTVSGLIGPIEVDGSVGELLDPIRWPVLVGQGWPITIVSDPVELPDLSVVVSATIRWRAESLETQTRSLSINEETRTRDIITATYNFTEEDLQYLCVGIVRAHVIMTLLNGTQKETQETILLPIRSEFS
jgi:hypothetical protein